MALCLRTHTLKEFNKNLDNLEMVQRLAFLKNSAEIRYFGNYLQKISKPCYFDQLNFVMKYTITVSLDQILRRIPAGEANDIDFINWPRHFKFNYM